jgi:hypothetical protein
VSRTPSRSTVFARGHELQIDDGGCTGYGLKPERNSAGVLCGRELQRQTRTLAAAWLAL